MPVTERRAFLAEWKCSRKGGYLRIRMSGMVFWQAAALLCISSQSLVTQLSLMPNGALVGGSVFLFSCHWGTRTGVRWDMDVRHSPAGVDSSPASRTESSLVD